MITRAPVRANGFNYVRWGEILRELASDAGNLAGAPPILDWIQLGNAGLDMGTDEGDALAQYCSGNAEEHAEGLALLAELDSETEIT